MSTTKERTSRTGDDDDRGPRLGALLRMCHQAFANRFEQGFLDAGLVPIIGAVTQPLWDRPEGMRQTELAELAGITKQSMGELVDQMEAAGYVERVPDPTDGRARIVRLTAKGRKAGRFARELLHDIEEEWAETIGRENLEAVRAGLKALVDARRDASPVLPSQRRR